MPNKNKWFLRETADQLKGITAKGLNRFAEALKDEIQKQAPGRIKIEVRKRAVAQKITVAATHPEGNEIPGYVEFGTPPHVITPKTKQVLRWVGEGGDEHFAKRVFHPGTDPNPFFRRGLVRASFLAERAFHTV